MDEKNMMQPKKIPKDKSQAATIVMIVIMAVVLLFAYMRITAAIEERSLGRMEENVKTVIEEVQSKLNRDSRLLNAAADIISADQTVDIDSMQDILNNIAPLLETMNISILFPDDSILQADGTRLDASHNDGLSFEREAPLGEHVSDRVYSIPDNIPILRHFVPITKDGKTTALLYGVTRLENLPTRLNTGNIYNSSAHVYIIDTKTGDFIMDTYHETLGNLSDYTEQEVRGSMTWDAFKEELLGEGTGYIVFRPTSEDEWEYLNYAPIHVNQWVIAVSVPEKEALTSVYAVRDIGVVVGVLIAGSIILYYLWIRRNARMRMEQAVEQAVLVEKLQKAEAADRAKSIFLSNMSHDIRTPMNAIIGFTTLAQTNLDNKERLQDYLRKTLSSCNHLLSLINDILDMSRIESGKLNIEEKECSISDIFRDMRNIIQNQMQSKQLSFFMDTLDVNDEDIYCDKLHVNQVLLNLLSNAIKFTPAGGTVSLTVQQKPSAPTGYGSYEIRVKDTGIGMSPEFAEHIFEPFERERTSTVSGIQGTGLGMAITKNIVDSMGGTIRVETEQGKGTEFILNFDFKLQSVPKKIEKVRELEGMRALVVDDSYSTCDSVTKMLWQIGMRPEWTLHGKEAVLRARQAVELGDSYKAYVIDWLLPDLSGLEVVRQIRGIAGDDTPIIIITAYDWSAFEDEAREAGVTAFCGKPIFLSDLQDTLLEAVGKGTMEQESVLPNMQADFKGTRILLVEDNEVNREIAEMLLSTQGFVVESAWDGSMAVDMVKQSEPGYYQLILMDIQMPVMNGYDSAKAIRALESPELSAIPIVAMTADAFEEDKKRALECGMNAHVAKPIDMNQLMEVIADILK